MTVHVCVCVCVPFSVAWSTILMFCTVWTGVVFVCMQNSYADVGLTQAHPRLLQRVSLNEPHSGNFRFVLYFCLVQGTVAPYTCTLHPQSSLIYMYSPTEALWGGGGGRGDLPVITFT